MSKELLLLNGPNLNLLGSRRPELYGSDTLDQIVERVRESAVGKGYSLRALQSNSEGTLIDEIHKSIQKSAGIIINPGAYSHTSIALRDALECFPGPVIEVHISNIFKREPFRQHSYVSEVATGVVCGLGTRGYDLALAALMIELEPKQ